MDHVALGRTCGDADFMEDFSDMLLLKLLNTSITAADDNEKVCVYKASQVECFICIRGSLRNLSHFSTPFIL